MKFIAFHVAASAAAITLLLSGCGGGEDEGIFVVDKDPSSSGITASVVVSAAGSPDLNGTYGSNNILLNNVTKVSPIDEPETCRFRFSGLVQTTNNAHIMDGDIRYIPANPEVRTTFMSISTIEFRLEGSAGVTVDRTNNRVVYNGAVLTSTQGTGQRITVTGAIPMRGDRPEGC